jgi:hypothetical protein
MEGEVAQTMYTHVSKCKNDKIKKRNVVWLCSGVLFSHKNEVSIHAKPW